MNYRKEIFCRPVQFFLDMFHSNKVTLKKKMDLSLNIYALHFKKPSLVLQIYNKKLLDYSYKE